MGFYGCLWVSMSAYRFLWMFMKTYGYLWVFMGVMGVYVSLWVSMGIIFKHIKYSIFSHSRTPEDLKTPENVLNLGLKKTSFFFRMLKIMIPRSV